MMILQILSHKSCLYNKRLPSYDIFLSILPPKNTFWGVASPPKIATRQNQFFFEVLAYLAGIKNYTFFKFFFHSTLIITAIKSKSCAAEK